MRVFLAASTFNSKRSVTAVTGAALAASSAAVVGAPAVATGSGAASFAFSGAFAGACRGVPEAADAGESCCATCEAAGVDSAPLAAVCAACFDARHARRCRTPIQLPASRAIKMMAVIPQANHGWSGVTTGGLPVHTGTLVPLVIFNCSEEALRDARGGGNFLQGNAAHFPLTFEAFAESAFVHCS